MNEAKVQQILDNLSGNARKVLMHVPDTEPMAASKIHQAVSVECNHELRVTRGCLRSLHDAGLIKMVSRERYQRKVDVPGPRTLKSLETTAPTPTLGDIMKPVLTGTNFAQPIPPREDPAVRRESALDHLRVTTVPAPKNEFLKLDPVEAKACAASPLAQLASLAGELLDAVEAHGTKVKGITKRLEDLALSIEADREANGKAAAQLAKFRALLEESE